MLLPRLLLASGLSQSCVRLTLVRLDRLGSAHANTGAAPDLVVLDISIIHG